MKVLIGFFIFLTVALIVALVEYIRDKNRERFTKWVRWMTSNIGKGVLTAITSFFGRAVPTKLILGSGDSKFMVITEQMAKEALNYAERRMISEGIIYPAFYLERSFDCENFGFAKKLYVDMYIREIYGQKGKGIPTSVIGYKMDKGGGHAVLRMVVNGVSVYTNVYPQLPSFYKFELTSSELKTLQSIG